MRIVERIALVVAGGVAGAVVALGLGASGIDVDWAAAGTITAIVSAIAAFVFAAVQLRQQTRTERRTHKPYLRADVAFREPVAREDHLELPESTHVYTARELAIEHDLRRLQSAVAPGSSDDATFALVLWVANLQDAALGVADSVLLRVEALWAANSDDWIARRFDSLAFDLTLAYLEPGQTAAVELIDVRRDIPYLFIRVVHLQYWDLFGGSAASDATHGALSMVYDRGAVRNERSVRREEEAER